MRVINDWVFPSVKESLGSLLCNLCLISQSCLLLSLLSTDEEPDESSELVQGGVGVGFTRSECHELVAIEHADSDDRACPGDFVALREDAL
jgi:hypothetical protein